MFAHGQALGGDYRTAGERGEDRADRDGPRPRSSPIRARRLRYRGAIANNAWIHTRAAALNLRTLLNLGLTSIDGHWSLPTTA